MENGRCGLFGEIVTCPVAEVAGREGENVDNLNTGGFHVRDQKQAPIPVTHTIAQVCQDSLSLSWGSVNQVTSI